MRVTWEDLEDLIVRHLATNPPGEFAPGHGGMARAILDVAKQLQPNLVFRAGMVDKLGARVDAARWLENVGELEVWLDQLGRAPQFVPGAQHRTLPLAVAQHLLAVAVVAWKEPTEGPIREFPFVANPQLRAMAERDYTSALDAQRIADYLVAVVMVGSVVEAMLLDLLVQNGSPLDSVTNRKLEELIRLAKPHLRHTHTFPDVERIRDHRNRVHPGRVLKESLPDPTRADAMVALGALQRLIEDLTPETDAAC